MKSYQHFRRSNDEARQRLSSSLAALFRFTFGIEVFCADGLFDAGVVLGRPTLCAAQVPYNDGLWIAGVQRSNSQVFFQPVRL